MPSVLINNSYEFEPNKRDKQESPKRLNQDVPDPIVANVKMSDSSSIPAANSFSSRLKDDKIEEIFPNKDQRIVKLQEEEDYKSEQIPPRVN